ncbi:hypothetical protein [Vibrio spartinae]|uniref:Lipoprotein n=1 Tax=Vibrio spartinae TaxID=1918945 RepID=A0A1N6LZB7_9VIBR|nr:hypothetical protein [Vibrio spartinae]SIO92519.1 hypothetical protein VSP9026_00131 [Vibrio spartinae]
MSIVKKIIVYSFAFIGCISLLFLSIAKFDNDDSFKKEIVSGILWINAPDDSNGFKILSSKHPLYNIVVFHRDKEFWVGGSFLYKGNKLHDVHLSNITGFDGQYIYLNNDEYLKYCDVKCN